jgi:hypothetical protein
MTARFERMTAGVPQAECTETIMAALLDALCSPQLYEIRLQGSELFIKPRAGMHPAPVTSDIGSR